MSAKTEGRVTVRLPRERGEQEDKVVWVNNDRYVIRRGVPVEVPAAVAEVLTHEEEMLDRILAFERARRTD